MVKFSISKLAEADIIAIGYYTGANWGIEQSNEYLRNLYKCFDLIVDNPHIGKTCNEIRQGYYKYIYKKHIIFYRINKIIEIMRILNQNVYINQHLQ